MDRDRIELEVREPTGLSLGTFDLHVIRQKVYEGDFHARCEFRHPDGRWLPLPQHRAISEVFWLLGEEARSGDTMIRRAKFGGWKTDAKDSNQQASVRLDTEKDRKKKGGLLGRLLGGKD